MIIILRTSTLVHLSNILLAMTSRRLYRLQVAFLYANDFHMPKCSGGCQRNEIALFCWLTDIRYIDVKFFWSHWSTYRSRNDFVVILIVFLSTWLSTLGCLQRPVYLSIYLSLFLSYILTRGKLITENPRLAEIEMSQKHGIMNINAAKSTNWTAGPA